MNLESIVCIGDSLTAGYGVQTHQRWSHLLSCDLNIDVINSGISGDTTAGMLARFHEMAIKHNPSHIIITGGTNDLFLNLSDNIIVSNILAMTRYAKYHGVTSIIGIPTPFFNQEVNTDENQFKDDTSVSKRISSFQEILKQYALNDNYPIIDFTVHMTPDVFLKDGLHPNQKGHRIMAENAKASLNNYFNHI